MDTQLTQFMGTPTEVDEAIGRVQKAISATNVSGLLLVREDLQAEMAINAPLDTPVRNRLSRLPGNGSAHSWYVNALHRRNPMSNSAISVKPSEEAIPREDTLSQVQESFLMGTVCGDACITKRGNSYRVRFNHSQKQLDYLLLKEKIMYPYIKMGVYKWKQTLRGKVYNGCTLVTRASKVWRSFYDLFYGRGGAKKVTSEIVRSLDDFSLAVWYMDDGTLSKARKHGRVYYKSEITLGKANVVTARTICEVFRTRFGNVNITRRFNKAYKRTYYGIVFEITATRKFVECIAPFVPECMRYKIVPVTANTQSVFDKKMKIWSDLTGDSKSCDAERSQPSSVDDVT